MRVLRILGSSFGHILRRTFQPPAANFPLKSRRYCEGVVWWELDKETEELLDDEEYEEIVPANLRQRPDGCDVLLIQPRVKWGKQKTQLLSITTPELQLEEGVALIDTLRNWRVVDKLILPTSSMKNKLLFGSGTLENIGMKVHNTPDINAVVLGVDVLSGFQQSELEEIWDVPVYDRFSVVLQIFNEHARSKESKLQVALAEIPYVRSRLRELSKKGKDRATGTKGSIAGSGESYLSERQRILEERARKLTRALEKVKANRQLRREQRQRLQIPVVAVVGYTNCGKTTLIKSLTRDERLEPKDHLFATLDVTVHSGSLPILKQVLYVDTVGFICNIPTTLIAAFTATLKEVALADLVLHVNDVSHPDLRSQKKAVIKTIQDLQVGEKLQESMLEVGNKIDKLPSLEDMQVEGEDERSDLLISATEGINLGPLKEEIQRRLIANTNRFFTTFRVPSGGEEANWLYKETSVHEATADPKDNNFMLLSCLINFAAFGRFKKLHGLNYLVEEKSQKEDPSSNKRAINES